MKIGEMIKHGVQRGLGVFGYTLHKSTSAHRNGFAAQAALVARSKGRVSTIVDAGAAIGKTAQTYHRYFPQATIIAFEPFPSAFAQLQHTARETCGDRVTCEPFALSDVPGEAVLHTNAQPDTNSLLPPAADGAKWWRNGRVDAQQEVRVQITSLDVYAQSHHLSHIDILKMDIQGGELKALRGAEALLARQGIGMIYTEVLFTTLYEGQGGFGSIVQYLEERGYRLFDLFDKRYAPDGSLKWADALFVSKAYQV